METNDKPKKKIFKALGPFIKNLLRGTLKSVPIVGPVIELSQNIRDEIKDKDKRHNYISISMQLICTSLIVYLFATKQLTIDQVLEYLVKITNLFNA